MIPSMRVGIDFRGAQCSGSGLRGIGRYTLEMIVGLLKFAPDLEIVLFVKPNVELPDELKGCKAIPVPAMSWTDPTDALWTKIPKIRSSNFLHGRRCRQAIKEQRAAMEKALADNPVDLLHIPSALDIGSYPIYDYPCPVVMTFLDAIVIKLRENTYNRFRPFQQTYYDEQSANLQNATRIVAISKASAKDAAEVFHLDLKKIDVVYPAVSDEYERDWPKPGVIGATDLTDKPFFLFCSVPDPHKNPDVVVEAFASIPKEFQLVFVSPTDSEFVPSLRNKATQLGFGDRFHVTGYVSEEQLFSLFKHATALVSPSQMEGFGLPVAQAMKAGTPVITSRYSAQGEIAEGVGYLVDPNSSGEVAEAMHRIIKEGRDPDRMAKGRERAKLFDAEKVTNELVSAYRRALHSSSPMP